MTPYLVTPPSEAPVDLSALKAHLRVTHDEDDADIAARQDGVVAMLDGHGGVLGRCIMPQVWAVDVTGPGPHLLPFPDASEVTANGESVAPERTPAGPCVTADVDPDEAVTIQATYGLSPERMPTALTLIKLMVAREFDQMAGADFDAATRSIEQHIAALRWRRV